MSVKYIEHPKLKMVELIVDGKITEKAFDEIFPQMEDFIKKHGKIKIIEIIKRIDGFEFGVMGKGINFDYNHLKDFSHCAVVTDSGWIGPFTRMLSPFFDIKIKVFKASEESEAREWLNNS